MLHIGYGRSVPTDDLVMIVNRRGMTADTAKVIETLAASGRLSPCRGQAEAYAIVQRDGETRACASILSPNTLLQRAETARPNAVWVRAGSETDFA